jgi:hypothetical protein
MTAVVNKVVPGTLSAFALVVVIFPPNALAKEPAPPPGVPFKVRGPARVKAAVVLIPWLAPVGPPVPVRLRVLVVPGVQALTIEMPCDPARVAVLVPDRLILPDEEMIPFVDPITIPGLAAEPEAAPVKEMDPLPVVVEIKPPLIKIPSDVVLLAPPVPFRVMLPPPVVLKVPPVSEIPWPAPNVALLDAVILSV